MDAQTIRTIRGKTPDLLPLLHYPGREQALRLSSHLRVPTRIAELRKGPAAGTLETPAIRAMVARCGSGVLSPADISPLLDPVAALGPNHVLTPAGEAGLAAVCDLPWREYTLSLAEWGVGARDRVWHQLSRRGGSLVLQVNFPAEHDRSFCRLLGTFSRKQFEYSYHPTRQHGPITLAWARLDADLATGDVLIEEVQNDWIRQVREVAAWQSRQRRMDWNRLRRLQAYWNEVLSPIAREWDRVTLSAAIEFAERHLGARRVFMHRARTGAALKGISGELPPRSIYEDLPKRLGLSPTRLAPGFLDARRGKALQHLRREQNTIFWLREVNPCPAAAN